MKIARAVIGSNFGDCGKGLLADYFSDESTTVVRFNGGAQAGHTVVTLDGLRHVFSHFGASSFRGAKTFLSRYFVANPLLFEKEATRLAEIGLTPHVVVDRGAMLTTPYDMLINQIVERWRGKERHGSCGVGIGETVHRTISTEHDLRVGDITDARFADRLDRIRRRHLPQRLAELTGDATLQDEPLVLNENLLANYIAACRRFVADSEVVNDGAWLSGQKSIVFEGAQGLLLDENHPRFQPHVTWSRTGIANAAQLAREANVGTLDVTYVTRTYLTRHGAGPLPGELRDFAISDATNVANEFQGSLRFAPLDIELLRESVLTDVMRGMVFINVNPSIAVTHLDQIADGERIASDVFAALDFPEGYVSYGPTRRDVVSGISVAA